MPPGFQVLLKNFTCQLGKLISTWPRYRPRPSGGSLTNGAVWNYLWIDYRWTLCYREIRTDESRKKAGKGVWKWRRCLKNITITWGKYIPPKEVYSRHHVDSKLKQFRDTERCVSERRPAFQMGLLLPTTRYERSICLSTYSEHKVVSIFQMGSIVSYVTWKSYL